MSATTHRHTPKSTTPDGLGGVRHRFEFANGYGASVIHTSGSYGASEGLWEVAVMLGDDLCYDTPITGDVIGWLTPEAVADVLDQIAALPAVER